MRWIDRLVLFRRKRRFSSYVDASCQVGSVLNGDARYDDVSIYRTLTADIETITCMAVAYQFAEHNDILR